MDKPELEADLARVDEQSITYAGYLRLDKLLDAQQPLTAPNTHHDEMLFIIQHQVAELWFKLCLHEVEGAIADLRQDGLRHCTKVLARIKIVQQQLYNQWSVLETLTPSEYATFRGVLRTASGFQSEQFRQLEFALGNRNAAHVGIHGEETAAGRALAEWLRRPSLYDEFLRYLSRHGHAIPPERVERDWAQPYESHPGVVEVLNDIYAHPDQYWDEYNVCEKLVDLEINFQLWRFRHVKTVERIIGHKRGTGGSSGVSFLRRTVAVEFFPELTEVRTRIGT